MDPSATRSPRSIAQRLLSATLILQFSIDALLALAGLVNPHWALAQLGPGTVEARSLLLIFTLSCFLLLICAFIAVTLRLLWRAHPVGLMLALTLGVFWVGFGAATALLQHRPEEWLLDVAPGLLLCGCVFAIKRTRNGMLER